MDEAIKELVQQVKDTAKPVEERRAALRHLCSIRGESASAVTSIPIEDLPLVVAAMTGWSAIGLRDLSLQAASEAVAEGRARAKQSNQRRA